MRLPGANFSMTTILSNFRLAILAALAAMNCIAAAQASPLKFNAITIDAGQVYVIGNGTSGTSLALPPPLVFQVGTITIAETGFADLQSNVLIVASTPFSTVYGYVFNGFGGGTWLGNSGPPGTGGGIGSSTAANDPTGLTGLGIINNAEAQYTVFQGVSLTAGTETLVKYTYYGDANLDGDVDAADFALMGTGSGWYHGDFNYDGVVDATDYDLYNLSSEALHPTPEPTTAALVFGGVAFLVSRRRRNGATN